jgi:hypothetical protein
MQVRPGTTAGAGTNYGQQLGAALGGLTNSFGGLNANAGGIASTQNLANQGTALFNAGLNRANTTTPWGTQSYSTSIDPNTGLPVVNQNVSLNPTLTGAQQTAQQSAAASLGRGAGSNVGQITGNVSQSMGDPAIQQAIQSQYNAQTGLLQPTFGMQSSMLDTQLANQGLQPGTDAYNNAKNLLAQQQNNAYTQIANNATQQGIGYQNQLFGQQLQNANLGNQAANQPLNQLLALNSGSQINAPNMAQSNAVPTDVLGAANLGYQGNVNAYNAQTGNQNAMMSGLFGLGGAGLNAYATNPDVFNGLFSSIFG